MGAEIGLLSDMPEVSWICYLLYLRHMGLSRGAPGRHPESSWNPEPCPDPIFMIFGWILGSIWELSWHNFRLFFGVRFWIQFWNGF